MAPKGMVSKFLAKGRFVRIFFVSLRTENAGGLRATSHISRDPNFIFLNHVIFFGKRVGRGEREGGSPNQTVKWTSAR